MAELVRCIRCDTNPAVDDQGYCGPCHWVVRAEVETGLYELHRYLRNWAGFLDWLRAHDQEP